MKKILNFFTILSLLTSTILVASSSDKASIIVLDASGSMWGKLKNGESKIEVARKVMGEYLEKRAETTPLGLVVYGHRKRGDCNDIEILSPVKVQDAQKLSKLINGIQPKGKTPLTAALALAVKQIPREAEEAEEADIILITDGLETCDQDPCALAEKIANEGIEIKAHVVGFGLSQKEVDSLSCIPQKTGGKLLRPQSGKELLDALATIETAKPKESTAPKTIAIGLRVLPTKGSIRPPWVEFFAKNLDNDEVINLGKREGAEEVLTYLETNLTQGKWSLFVKGELGQGELNTTLEKEKRYEIPYEASKTSFSLEDLGAYQLGIKQTFFLHINAEIQKGRQLKVALVPKGASTNSEIIDFSYLFGGTMGSVAYDFDSPKQEGAYELMVFASSMSDVLAKFDVVYKNAIEVRLEVPSFVEPNTVFKYKVYGNLNSYNRIRWVKDGKDISELTFYTTFNKKGFSLTSPSEKGHYEIHYYYKEGEEKRKAVVALNVGKVVEEKISPTPNASASAIAIESNTTKPKAKGKEVFYTPVGEVLNQEDIDAMMKKILKEEK